VLGSLWVTLRELVLLSEAEGVQRPDLLAERGSRLTAALEWFEHEDISMWGNPSETHPGRIDVLPQGGGGASPDSSDAIADWLSRELLTSHLQHKVKQLHDTGAPRQHLFLVCQGTGTPFDVFYALAFLDDVPTTSPALAGDVTRCGYSHVGRPTYCSMTPRPDGHGTCTTRVTAPQHPSRSPSGGDDVALEARPLGPAGTRRALSSLSLVTTDDVPIVERPAQRLRGDQPRLPGVACTKG